MLSILIPIYNYKVTELISELLTQSRSTVIAIEILAYDDASAPEWKETNKALIDNPDVQYSLLPQNVGRAKIRNMLAQAASFESLLFLDCDSGIIKKDFLETYIDLLPSEALVVGGRTYSQEKPLDKSQTLHWLYGHKKESRSLAERKAAPAKYFHSNNFVLPKGLLMERPFDESIQGYGYEDLALAAAFETLGVDIIHLDNPIEHLSLEDSETFLSKTRNAIDNLISLKNSGIDITTNLESFAGKVDMVKMRPVVQGYYKWNEKSILTNLHSDSPRLSNLDLYKLNYYFTQTSEHKKSL